jgi:hypothetical protein
MRTGLGIAPRIRLASPRVRPEITAHSRLIFLFPGRDAQCGRVAEVFSPPPARPGGRTAGPGVACAPGVPGREAAGPSRRLK